MTDENRTAERMREDAAYKAEEFEHIAEERNWRDGATQARRIAAAIRALPIQPAPVRVKPEFALPFDGDPCGCAWCADADAKWFYRGDPICDDCYIHALENALDTAPAAPALDASQKPAPAAPDDHEYCPSMDPNDCGDCIYCGNSAGDHKPAAPALDASPAAEFVGKDAQTFDDISRVADEWMHRAETAQAELTKLADPVAVYVNMLRGTIAKPTMQQIFHIYGLAEIRTHLAWTYGHDPDALLLHLDASQTPDPAVKPDSRQPTVTEAAETILDYDAGLLNDWGGGNVDWWLDYLRAEIGRANDHWRDALRQISVTEEECFTPLHEVSADAVYLMHRVQQGSLSPDDAAKVVRDKIEAALRQIGGCK